MTEVQERRKKTVEASMTEQVHLIMQQHLNGGGRLFGGALMQWLDEVAGVVAMRHAETYRVVTAAVDNLQFKHAIYEGEIVGELDPKTTTAEEMGLYMAGAKRKGA